MMAALLTFFGLAGVMASVIMLIARDLTRRQLRVWREAAGKAGLDDLPHAAGDRFFGETELSGRSGPLRVRFETYSKGRSETGTQLLIDGLGPGSEALTLEREGLKTQVFGHEIEIGDPAFDREVYVHTPAPLALAVLDRPAREWLLALLRGNIYGTKVRVAVDQGILDVRVPHRALTEVGGEQLATVLRNALELARHLMVPGDLAARLAANLQSETEAGVRLQLLNNLAGEYPDRPETREALLLGLQDASGEVRLRAATALGAEGEKALRELVADPATEDSCAARAVTALGNRLPAAAAQGALERALAAGGAGRSQSALACIDALGRRGDAAAEEPLVRALHHGNPQVALAAARALGRVGTVAAVAPLHAVVAGLLPTPLRSAAHQAIAEIQSRLPGAAPGQLELADGAPGALSLAAQEQGGLSLLADHSPLPRDPEPIAQGEDPAGLDPDSWSGNSGREAER